MNEKYDISLCVLNPTLIDYTGVTDNWMQHWINGGGDNCRLSRRCISFIQRFKCVIPLRACIFCLTFNVHQLVTGAPPGSRFVTLIRWFTSGSAYSNARNINWFICLLEIGKKIYYGCCGTSTTEPDDFTASEIRKTNFFSIHFQFKSAT